MRALKFLIPLALFGVLAWFLYSGLSLNPREVPSPLIGKPAPGFALVRLDEPQKTVRRDDLLGKPWIMNVWASWCVPCREESPALERFSRRNADRVVVLGIDTRDLSGDALDFIDEFGLTYPQLRDPDGQYADRLETTGVPESFLVDPEGRLARRLRGPFSSEADIARFAAPALRAAAREAPGVNG